MAAVALCRSNHCQKKYYLEGHISIRRYSPFFYSYYSYVYRKPRPASYQCQ